MRFQINLLIMIGERFYLVKDKIYAMLETLISKTVFLLPIEYGPF